MHIYMQSHLRGLGPTLTVSVYVHNFTHAHICRGRPGSPGCWCIRGWGTTPAMYMCICIHAHLRGRGATPAMRIYITIASDATGRCTTSPLGAVPYTPNSRCQMAVWSLITASHTTTGDALRCIQSSPCTSSRARLCPCTQS